MSCRNLSNDSNWQVQKVRSDGDAIIKKYQPLIQGITLSAGTRQSLTLISPLITANDSISPLAIFKELTQLNDSARHTSYKSSWYVVKLDNFSENTNWACAIDNALVIDSVFMIKSRYSNSLLKLKGVDIYEPYYKDPVGRLFELHIERGREVYLLLKFSTNEPTFLKKISLYAFNESKFKPVDDAYIHGFVIGISIFILIISLYFLFASKDVVYLIFLAHYLLYILQYYFLSDISSVTFKMLVVSTESIRMLFYTLLVMLPFTIYKWTKTLSILTFLILLQVIFTYSNFLLHAFIGSNFKALLGIIILIVYFIYAFEPNRPGKVGILSRILIIAIVFLEFFLTRNEFAHFLPFNYSGLPVVILHLILFSAILIIRFLSFKKGRQKMEVLNAINLQKEISGTVIKTLEEERKRISQDIHDELGGNLAILKLKMHSANIEKEKFEQLLNLVNRTSASARSIAYKLMPPYFSETEFKMLLFEHFNSLNEKGSMKFNFDYTGGISSISKEKELMIYRIIMELAQNCLKHSEATNVLLEYIADEQSIKIICTDNGKGFPPQTSRGIGMQSIHSRVFYLDGNININSGSTGTKIEITIPIK